MQLFQELIDQLNQGAPDQMAQALPMARASLEQAAQEARALLSNPVLASWFDQRERGCREVLLSLDPECRDKVAALVMFWQCVVALKKDLEAFASGAYLPQKKT